MQLKFFFVKFIQNDSSHSNLIVCLMKATCHMLTQQSVW